jgi:hypothetical protein
LIVQLLPRFSFWPLNFKTRYLWPSNS